MTLFRAASVRLAPPVSRVSLAPSFDHRAAAPILFSIPAVVVGVVTGSGGFPALLWAVAAVIVIIRLVRDRTDLALLGLRRTRG